MEQPATRTDTADSGAAAASPEVASPRPWRPGIALRVAIGFAAVALTVIVANVATQRSAREAQEKVRTLLVEHEPLVRATESLANAVSMYERTVIDQSESSAIAQQSVKAAATRLQDAAKQYRTAVANFPELDGPAPGLDAALSDLMKAGDELLQTSATRRARLRDYWSRFDALEVSLNAPQANAVRFAGAVFASEKLMDLTRLLAGIREQVSAAASVSTPRSAQLIIASENAFRTRLQQASADLAKVHGQGWLDQVKANFNALVIGRRATFESIETFGEQSALFRDQAAAVAAMVVTQLVEPARHALANADRLAMQASERADRHLGWASAATLLLLLIIAVVTVTGVTAPVRRLTEATRLLARGAVRTRVLRGGVRELDTLAEAFNQMAEQLQLAQDAVRAYQLELEARVDERTRELNHMAHHDPLTDLPNRRHLLAHLEGAIERARLSNSRIALLFIDLDNFKTINDSMGHAYGDGVLQVVAERLRMNSLFSRSFCARLGGDEFTVVCEEVKELGDVERLSRSVLEEFQRPLSVQGRELRISVSVGACIFPDHASDSHALLRAADSALFRAKELGRNCASLYAPQLLEEAASRFKVEQSLRRAVEQGEFELVYQPEVCFETLETHTVEALLRWRQPDGNVISPGEFFTVAEQTGLIADISDWALRTAIQTAATWHKGPWPKARVAVNISSQQLMTASFVSRLQALLEQHQLPPECLEIELTENVLQTGANTIATLRRLRDMGISIALDDFGTGYSSLTSLERLPLSRVKIDRSLVAPIDTGGRSPSIVRSIIGLCHSLGLQVTAEGVERPAQLGVLLTDRGIHIQGYLVSRPIDAAKVPVFVARAGAHLEDLMLTAPPPAQDGNTKRLRTLRTPLMRGARAARSPADEG
jgi:diguanylate cyclase (GGDEF)-like protein